MDLFTGHRATHRTNYVTPRDDEPAQYPHVNAEGQTVWACCESSIGPVCEHRREPEIVVAEATACDWFVNDATEPSWCCNTHMYDGTGDYPDISSPGDATPGDSHPDLCPFADAEEEVHELPDGGTYQDATPILARLTREREEEQARLTRTVTIARLESVSAHKIARKVAATYAVCADVRERALENAIEEGIAAYIKKVTR